FRRECLLYGVAVGAADDFNLAAVGLAAQNQRCPAFPEDLAARRTDLVSKAAARPIDSAIRAQRWPVEIISHAGAAAAGHQPAALLKDAGVVRAVELPQARRRCRVDRVAIPENALGENQPPGDDRALVEVASALGVFEKTDHLLRVFPQHVPLGV